jgi:hypothetical protein
MIIGLDTVTDPDPRGPKLSPEKGRSEEISFLKSVFLGRRLLMKPERLGRGLRRRK